MAAIIKDKTTNEVKGWRQIDSPEQLRSLEKEYIVVPFFSAKAKEA